MSLDKFLLDQQIVDRAIWLVGYNKRCKDAERTAFEMKRELKCTASKVFPCREKTKDVTAWCDNCKKIGPLEYKATLAFYQVGTSMKALTKLVETRERVFPHKSKNGRKV